MKKLFFISVIAFLFVALISCEKDDVLPANQVDFQDELITSRENATVPFRATYSVHTVEVGTPPCEIFEFYLLADGTALHLGNSTWESCTSVDFPGGMVPFDCSVGMGFEQIGTMTFTAANGAELFGNFWGIFDGAVGCGDFVITHGTGRFEGYTGEGTYEWIDMGADPNPLTFVGTLTKP